MPVVPLVPERFGKRNVWRRSEGLQVRFSHTVRWAVCVFGSTRQLPVATAVIFAKVIDEGGPIIVNVVR